MRVLGGIRGLRLARAWLARLVAAKFAAAQDCQVTNTVVISEGTPHRQRRRPLPGPGARLPSRPAA